MIQIQQLKQQHSLASWKQTILAQQNSGLTAAEYCRQQSIDGLAALVLSKFQLDPHQPALFLFCGRRKDRIKGLL